MRRNIFPILIFFIVSCKQINANGLKLEILDASGQTQSLTFAPDGSIVGDQAFIFSIFSIVQGKRKIDKWRQQTKPNTIEFTGDFTFLAHIYRNHIIFDQPRHSQFARFRHYSLVKSLSSEYPELKLTDYYTPDQVDFLNVKERIYFAEPESGLVLREKPDQKSKALSLMSLNDKFYSLEAIGPEIVIDNRPGRWLLGYWHCQKGYAFSGYLTRKLSKHQKRRVKKDSRPRGFFALNQVAIKEYPNESSRLIWNSPMNDLIRYSELPESPEWVYVETGSVAHPIGFDETPDPICGCIKKDNLGQISDLKRVEKFVAKKFEGWFGDAGIRYECTVSGTCELFNIETPYAKAGPIGKYEVYKYKEFYVLMNSKGIWQGFRLIDGKVCGLDSEGCH